MMEAGVGEIVFIAIFSQIGVHQSHTGRFVVKGADVQQLDAKPFLDR